MKVWKVFFKCSFSFKEIFVDVWYPMLNFKSLSAALKDSIVKLWDELNLFNEQGLIITLNLQNVNV